jgi:hypothetical protein
MAVRDCAFLASFVQQKRTLKISVLENQPAEKALYRKLLSTT